MKIDSLMNYLAANLDDVADVFDITQSEAALAVLELSYRANLPKPPEVSEALSEPKDRMDAYLARGGGICPHCGSGGLERGRVIVEGGEAQVKVTCTSSCDAIWYDSYQLSSIIEDD